MALLRFTLACSLTISALFADAAAADSSQPARAESAESAEGAEDAQPPAKFGVFVEADGVEETFAFCTPCHSAHIVAQQRLAREDWDAVLEDMVDEQGMVQIPEPTRTRILNYLSERYGRD